MDWLPAITATSMFAACLWLARSSIAAWITSCIRHEYDEKLEELRSVLRCNEAELESLRAGTLSLARYRHEVVFSRNLDAIEMLWGAVVALMPAKKACELIGTLHYDAAEEEAAINPEFRKFFSIMGENFGLNNYLITDADKSRPFVSPMSWALFSAYRAIISLALAKIEALKRGMKMGEVFDEESVKRLATVALPEFSDLIDKSGPAIYHLLLGLLETKLLNEFDKVLNGVESDKASIEQAAAIIKEATRVRQETDKQESVQ